MYIRRATPTDADALGDLHFRSHKANFKGIARQEWWEKLEPTRFQRRWHDYFATEHPREALFVAVDNDAAPERIVAMMAVRQYDDTWRFYEEGAAFVEGTTAVMRHAIMEPDLLHRGIGRQLYAACMDFIHAQGYETVLGDTFRENDRARKFAAHFGFTEVWERDRDGDPHHGDVIFKKRLR